MEKKDWKKNIDIEKEQQPMISVIVPVYNVERYLDRCLTSISAQSYRNLEILLINDGSTDKSGSICKEWEKKDSRIRLFQQENRGLSAARNRGIDEVLGEYLCFVDSDDYLSEQMLEALMKELLLQNAEIAVCNLVYEYEDKEEEVNQEYQIREASVVSGQEFITWMDQGKYAFCEVVCNKLYKRKLFDDIRFPEGKVHEDEFVFHRLIYPRKRIACIPMIGYHYWRHTGSITTQNKWPEDYLEALMERCIYFSAHGEQRLTLENEKRLIGAIRRLQNQNGRRAARKWKRTHWGFIKELYKKQWISPQLLLKRFIRCCFL